MLQQYFKFFINGAILGALAWALQLLIYDALGGSSSAEYTFATAITYAPLVLLNFMVQRTLIFNRPGLFWRFVAANLAIMVLVSFLSPVCKVCLDALVGHPWGERGGFAIAALAGSVPSFLLKRRWVFGLKKGLY